MNYVEDEYWDDDYWVPDQNGNPYYPYIVNGINCAFWPYHTDNSFLWMYDNDLYTVYEQNNRSEVYRNNEFIGLFQHGSLIN